METDNKTKKQFNGSPLVKPKRIRIVGKNKNWVELDYEQFKTLIHINYLTAVLRSAVEDETAA